MAANHSAVYIELAEAYHGKGRFQERDRFLILAADSAWTAGAIDEAERLRNRILDYNPNHLLRPYATFDEALKSADIQAYVQQLRRGYPRERAVELLKEVLGDARKGDAEETLAADSPIFKLAPPAAPRFDLPAAGGATAAARPKVAESAKAPAPAAPRRAAPVPNANPVPVSRQLVVDKPVRQPAPRPEPGRMAGPMPEDLGGAWVGGLLFSLILAMTLLMLVYLFVQPFYPILPL